MLVFEQMLDMETRIAFCDRKAGHFAENDEEFLQLKDYILSPACEKDIARLQNGDYYFSIPVRFYIRKIHSNRRRVCYKFAEQDNYLMKLMSYVLMEYDDLYAESLYSYRKEQNHRTFFKKLRALDFDRHFYVLKMDVHSYGESIDQDILLEMLQPLFREDPAFYHFLHWILKRNQFYENGILHAERVSIIPGMPIGAFLNNLYLSDMDYYLEAHSALYMRYTDDMAVFTDSREKAEELKAYVFKTMQERKLEVNEEKTCIYAPGETYSILGIRVSENEFDIAPESLNKILFKMHKKSGKLLKKVRRKVLPRDVAMRIMMKYVNNYFWREEEFSQEICWTRWAFGIITTDASLKVLDREVQNCIRIVSSGKTGNARYRTGYQDLKAAGFRSLVHAYYTQKQEK